MKRINYIIMLIIITPIVLFITIYFRPSFYQSSEAIATQQYYPKSANITILPNLQEGRVHPLIKTVPTLHSLVEEYLNTDRIVFAEKYTPQELWDQGFYAQPHRPGYQDSPLFGYLKVLRASKRCQEAIIGTIKIGDSRNALVELLGEPHFRNNQHDGFYLTGYRFADFYVMVLGDDWIEEITFVGDAGLHGREANELLNDFNRTQHLAELVEINATPYYKRVNTAFSQELYYVNGIHMREKMVGGGGKTVLVFANFEGDIYCSLSEETYKFIDEDSMFYLQRDYYRNRVKQLEQASNASPNGNQVILHGLSTRPINGDSFYIHFLDESSPDILVYTRHGASNYCWLNDRYLLYTVDLPGDPTFVFDVETQTDLGIVGISIILSNQWAEEWGYELRELDDGESYILDGTLKSILFSPCIVENKASAAKNHSVIVK